MEEESGMSQPHITAICLTYGRPQHLEEAITCFLAQDYTGPKELLILNSFPRQTLICDAPNVRIINLPERPPSLGDARNLAIEHAAGTHLITFDDDDLYLPHHLSLMAEHFGGNDWIWFSRQFYSEHDRIKSVVGGSANVVAFTKAAWEAVGRYRSMGTGEDRDFVGRLTSSRPGQRVDIAADRCSFVYCWANGVHHISGLGDDPPGRLSSYQRAHMALERLVRQRKVPVGEIRLKPKPRNKCVGMAQQFLAKLGGGAVVAAPVDTHSVGIVQLGRYGDIINILPICRHVAKVYRKPHLICGREFAQLLDGVSYVDPFPVDLGHGQLPQAMDLAKKHFTHVINAQIWGIGWQQERSCDSFNRESWRNAGFLSHFSDPSWRVVFDRRNRAREEALANKLNVNGRPMVLVCLSGISSPFRSGPALLEAIRAHFSAQFQIIDLSNFRAERIFDVLGLMDRAAALVTVDSGLLHLAAGSAVPVVALVNPVPWLGSAPRAKCVARIPYVEADRDPQAVIFAISHAVTFKPEVLGPVEPLPEAVPAPRIFHAVAKHGDRPSAARKQKAQGSWIALYRKGVIARHFVEPYARSSKALGDRRRTLPYLKDLLAFGMADAADNDIIMVTNDDNGLDPRLPDLLRCHVAIYGACCSFRTETKGTPRRFSMGRDMFAFTKSWLQKNWDKIPDFLLGVPDWDWCLAAIVRQDFGIRSSRRNMEDVLFPAEIAGGYVTHQSHVPRWSMEQNSPSTLWNKKLYQEWLGANLPDFYHAEAPKTVVDSSVVPNRDAVRRIVIPLPAQPQHDGVSAVIAVYKPNLKQLHRSVASVLPQVQEVIIAGDLDTPWPISGLPDDPKIKCVRMDAVFTGYGKKATFGASHATGRYLHFLNDDAYLNPDVIQKCRAEMVGDVAVVTHTLRYLDGTIQYAGKFRRPGSMLFEHIDHRKQSSRYNRTVEQEAACGASMMVRADAFARVNGYDDLFFLYSEDDDLVMRLRQIGYKAVFTPFAEGLHEEHSSMDGKTPKWMDILHHSNRLFVERWAWYFKRNQNPDAIGRFPLAVVVKRTIAAGDVLLATPIITALKAQNPELEIFVESDYPEIFQGNPDVAKAEKAINMPGARMIDLTMAYESRPEMNYLDAYAAVAGVTPTDRSLRIFPNDSDRAFALQKLGDVHRWCAINAGNPCVNRVWPLTNYGPVVSHLRNIGFKVVQVGKFPGFSECDLSLIGRTTLHQLTAIIEKCALFIGIDSLPLHLACATGTTAIGLFGPTLPERALAGPGNVRCVVSDPNHPWTGARHSRVSTTIECGSNPMESITPEQVIKQIDALVFQFVK